MPIPLTPPDDEAGISIPNFSYYHLGLLKLIIMAHLPFSFRLCQSYDYVYLYLEAMPCMTLLSLYLYIHFQFILF